MKVIRTQQNQQYKIHRTRTHTQQKQKKNMKKKTLDVGDKVFEI